MVKYDYDGSGNQTAITYPDNSVVTYEYDGVNNLTSVTEDDAIGQLLNVTDSDPTQKDMKQQKHVYRYDDCGNMVYEYMRGNGTGEATVKVWTCSPTGVTTTPGMRTGPD